MAKDIIKTGMTKAQTKEAVVKAMEIYSQKFEKASPTFHWIKEDVGQFAFSAKGMNMTGTIEVEDGQLSVEMNVPFLLKPMKGWALEIIQKEVQKWAEKIKSM